MPTPEMKRLLPGTLLAALSAGCVGPPAPTPEALRLAANPRAVVEGRVLDPGGRPVAGVRVQAVPRGDISWSGEAETDNEGRFRLSLYAPADYGFLIFEGDHAVVTDSPRDPALLHVPVEPGQTKRGVELCFLREAREKVLGS